MAEVIRQPETDDSTVLDEWTHATANVEAFGCGEADEADRQGIQPLITES